jgi:hypothetical protein
VEKSASAKTIVRIKTTAREERGLNFQMEELSVYDLKKIAEDVRTLADASCVSARS